MGLVRTLELRSGDADALCCLFVDGVLAALGRGVVRAPISTGQHVRWIVHRRRGAATWVLQERAGRNVWLIETGRSARRLLTGTFEARRRRRSPAARGAPAGAPGHRVRGGIHAVARRPVAVVRGLLPRLEG